MKYTIWGVAVVFGAAMLLSSCSSGTPGQPQPASTSEDSPTSATIRPSPTQAPKVAAPLNATQFTNNPCSSLTSSDLAGLNIAKARNGGILHNPSGVACTWSGEAGGGIGIGWETTNTNGLSDLYAKSNLISYWQPTTISGYPAAYGDSISDGRTQGDCVINVAVNDRLYFTSQYTDPSIGDQSCKLAQRGAADVIANLRGAA